MKDIQKIIMEMEKLTKEQVAVELSEEEKAELASLINADGFKKSHCGKPRPTPTPTPTPTPAPCEPCNNVVDFCCKVSIPSDFEVNLENADKKLTAVSCLYCFVDPCPCEVSCTPPAFGSCAIDPFKVTLFPVRVIGCIQFVASATGAIRGETPSNSSRCLTDTADICCQGSICVNQVVNFKKTAPTQEQSTPKKIPLSDLSCTLDVTLEDCDCFDPGQGSDKVVSFTGSDKVVSFSGSFILPTECPEPTPCPTAPIGDFIIP